VKAHREEWVSYLRQQGYGSAEPLAAGMEGAVYRLGGGLVAKIWDERPASDLAGLQRFYADLLLASLPFATPEIVAIQEVDGSAVTIERELSGRPLRDYLNERDNVAVPAAAECVLTVLRGLGAVTAAQSARDLPVLGADEPFRSDRSWPDAVRRLLDDRTAAFGEQLSDAVPGFGALYANLSTAISELGRADGDFVIHGDICGENILVDDDLNLLALLDWGFLSTAGDPAFDASVAAGIFNMYGPSAAEIDRQLRRLFEAEFGYPAELLTSYRAAYAVITSNVYDPAGQDGHFAWCVRQLSSPEVRAIFG
jgi:aminoglycoside phosphotransferase (APT) family kinase protein